MRNPIWMLAGATALIAATPLAAQENVAAPVANATNETMAVDANAALDANLVALPPADAVEPAAIPTDSQPSREAAGDSGDRRGFPWGLLGLIGLIGLLGRRHANSA